MNRATTSKQLTTGMSPRAGVVYFDQYPKHFVRPYGPPEECPKPELVFHRTTPKSCEWYLRPQTALSELAQTVVANHQVVDNSDSEMWNPTWKEKYLTKISEIADLLKPFDIKDPGAKTHGPKNIKAVMKYLLREDNALDSFLSDTYKIGAALFNTSLHLTVVRTLFNHPIQYAEKLVAKPEHEDFKSQKSIKSLRKMMESLCLEDASTTAKTSSGTKRNLLRELESTSDEDDTPPPPKKKKKSKKAKKE